MGPIQKKWLKALRSGEYKQCQKTLSDSIGYCCLGVAACVLGMEKDRYNSFIVPDEFSDYGDVATICDELNYDIYSQLGLRDAVGVVNNIEIDGITGDVDLVSLNDTLKWTFPQIADFIEQNEPKVFNKEV